MANALYDGGREGILDQTINWPTGNIKLVLVDTGAYTVDLANHRNLSDIPSGARISTSGNLASKTSTAGVADAADLTITGVTGTSIEAAVLYVDTGTATTSRLICYLDTITGFPFTPSGADCQIVWDNGANKIFKL